MLILIDVNTIQEVSEIITLLLINNKKSFNVFENETEMLQKFSKFFLPTENLSSDRHIQGENFTFRVEKLDDHLSETTSRSDYQHHQASQPISPPQDPKTSPNSNKKSPLLNWNFNAHSEMKPLPANTFDESELYDFQPTRSSNVRRSNVVSTRSSRRSGGTTIETFQCTKCSGSFPFRQLQSHSIIHTSLLRYQCPVSGCGKKSRHRSTIAYHLPKVHKIEGASIPECINPQELAELNRKTSECFPESVNHRQKS